jgi:hypothetical protein
MHPSNIIESHYFYALTTAIINFISYHGDIIATIQGCMMKGHKFEFLAPSWPIASLCYPINRYPAL